MSQASHKMSFTQSTASYFLLVEVAFSFLETITGHLPFSLPTIPIAEDYANWFLGTTLLVLGMGFLVDRAAKAKQWGLPPLLLIYALTAGIIVVFQQYNSACHHIVLALGSTGFFVLLPSTFGPWIKRLKAPSNRK